MVSRPLGRTGLLVSPIALGTTKLGRNTGVKYPKPFALPSDEQLGDLLQSCFSLGVNLIDTAPAYGESEQRLGPFVAANRHRLVISTKCGEQYHGGASIYDFSATAITASIEQSLRHLKTDYVDIVLLHSNGQDVELLTQSDALEALMRLKNSGKASAVGISAKTPDGILLACQTLDVIMAPFSLRQTSLADTLTQAHEAGIGILAIKGLSSGHLDAGPAIEFVLRQPFIDALILGTTDPKHLSDAVDIAERVSN